MMNVETDAVRVQHCAVRPYSRERRTGTPTHCDLPGRKSGSRSIRILFLKKKIGCIQSANPHPQSIKVRQMAQWPLQPPVGGGWGGWPTELHTNQAWWKWAVGTGRHAFNNWVSVGLATRPRGEVGFGSLADGLGVSNAKETEWSR